MRDDDPRWDKVGAWRQSALVSPSLDGQGVGTLGDAHEERAHQAQPGEHGGDDEGDERQHEAPAEKQDQAAHGEEPDSNGQEVEADAQVTQRDDHDGGAAIRVAGFEHRASILERYTYLG